MVEGGCVTVAVDVVVGRKWNKEDREREREEEKTKIMRMRT